MGLDFKRQSGLILVLLEDECVNVRGCMQSQSFTEIEIHLSTTFRPIFSTTAPPMVKPSLPFIGQKISGGSGWPDTQLQLMNGPLCTLRRGGSVECPQRERCRWRGLIDPVVSDE